MLDTCSVRGMEFKILDGNSHLSDHKFIFLASQPRSGSTMLQAILGTHSRIHTSSEPWIAFYPLLAFKKGAIEAIINADWASTGMEAFLGENQISRSFYEEKAGEFIAAFYNQALEKSGKDIFLDKTPRYYEILPELARVFPASKIILLQRDPLWVIKSILKSWVKEESSRLFYYTRDLFSAIDQILEFKLNSPGNQLSLKYEDLTAEPERQVQDICGFLGIEYESAMLNYERNPDWVFGDKNFLGAEAIKKAGNFNSEFSQLSQLHLNFVYFYLMELGEHRYDAFGYDFDSAYAQIKALKPSSEGWDMWRSIVDTRQFLSMNESYSDFHYKMMLNHSDP